MTVVEARPEKNTEKAPPSSRGWTTADLARLPDTVDSGSISWELWDGEFIALSPSSNLHGKLVSRMDRQLGIQGEAKGYGSCRAGDVGVVVSLTPRQSAFGANFVFITKEQAPERETKEGYILTVPALIGEVRSPNDRAGRIAEKIRRYLSAGARLVWDVDPKRRQVTAHRPEEAPVVFSGTDTLTAEGVIPGFTLPLQELFSGLV